MSEIRTQLLEVENRVRSLREERARLTKIFKSAQAAAADTETDATIDAAMSAKTSIKEVEQQLEDAQDEQIGLLRRVGDAEAGRSGSLFNGVDGWDDASRKLSLAEADLRVDLPAR